MLTLEIVSKSSTRSIFFFYHATAGFERKFFESTEEAAIVAEIRKTRGIILHRRRAFLTFTPFSNVFSPVRTTGGEGERERDRSISCDANVYRHEV